MSVGCSWYVCGVVSNVGVSQIKLSTWISDQMDWKAANGLQKDSLLISGMIMFLSIYPIKVSNSRTWNPKPFQSRSSIELGKSTANKFLKVLWHFLLRFVANMQFLPLNLTSKRLHFLKSLLRLRLLKCIIMTICDISGNLCQTINQQQYHMLSERKNCRQFSGGSWKSFLACRFLFAYTN